MSLAPLPPTPLLGRETELDTIEQRLVRDGVRLLSLTGPAGVGKTRLALEARERLRAHFLDGAPSVDLAPVRTPSLVLPTIAQALGLTDSGPRPLPDRLAEYFREREMLLLLDNFEQVSPAGHLLADLLAAAPRLQLLVTSRVPLRLRWERILRITPLTVPDRDQHVSFDALLRVPSIALFVERAQAQRASFTPTEQQASLLVKVARQLDGLPLALELAAANMQSLSLGVIVHRLGHRLESLQWEAQDLPDRQRSLHAAIGWSYELLSEHEQRLFRHLGVFVHRVSLNAIAAVPEEGDEEQTLAGLIALAEKSLVLPVQAEEEDPEPSFGMLETVRQYACEQLDLNGELEAAHRAHARYFLNLAERANPELRRRDHLVWFQRLEAEQDNLRTALRWLLDHQEYALALRMGGALSDFWDWRGYHAEGWRWLEEILAVPSSIDPANFNKAQRVAGNCLLWLGKRDQSRLLLEDALGAARENQDRVAIMEILFFLGLHALMSGEVARCRRLTEEELTLAADVQDGLYLALGLNSLAYVTFREGDAREAAALASNALSRLQADSDLVSATTVHFYLAWMLHELGAVDRAVQVVRTGLQHCLALGSRMQLCRGVEATLHIVGDGGGSEETARLLGARDALVQAIGTASAFFSLMSGHELPGDLEDLRARLEREGFAAAYRAGRSLSFPAIVDLAQVLLEPISRSRTPSETGVSDSALANPLSPREREVLRLVAQGLSNKQIAREMFIAQSTVAYYLTSIFNKLGVDTRTHAVAVAAQRGLVLLGEAQIS
jgi:predicted ATPase/DNA-binding CsgD family transcriptional regulator